MAGLRQQGLAVSAGVVRIEYPEASADEVAEQVTALEVGQRRPAINVAAGHGAALGVRVVQHGVREPGGGAAGGRVVAGKALAETPPVVAAALDDVDFLARALADVARPQPARGAVEAEAPRVAQAPGENLRAIVCALSGGAARIARKRVVGRDRVVARARDVDAEDGAHEVGGGLGIVERVAAGAAVADGNVQVTVGPELDAAPVVVVVGLVDGEQQLLGGRVEGLAAVAAPESRDDRLHAAAGGGARVGQVGDATGRVIGREGEAEQATLGGGVDDARQVEEHVGGRGARLVGEAAHAAGLFQHVPARGVAGGLQHVQRLLEAQRRKGTLHGKRRRAGGAWRRDAAGVHRPRVQADRRWGRRRWRWWRGRATTAASRQQQRNRHHPRVGPE